MELRWGNRQAIIAANRLKVLTLRHLFDLAATDVTGVISNRGGLSPGANSLINRWAGAGS